MTALHAEFGVLDATCADLAAAIGWEQVHKVRPRAPLTCRGCGRGMQAKVSHLGLRFFAHDAAVSRCPDNGETSEHRLLKRALAEAVRATGWTAEVEVPGAGWRADVLAVSPDGHRRFAWQVQLGAATADELRVRVAAMLIALDGVCWVTDKDANWVARVPSVRIRRDDTTDTLMVVDGAARFQPLWCEDRWRCDQVPGYAVGGRYAPCPGHGHWHSPVNLTLDAFVEAACAGKVTVHGSSVWREGAKSRHYDRGNTVWTAPRYVAQELEQLDAAKAVEQRREAQEAREAAHERRRSGITAPTRR